MNSPARFIDHTLLRPDTTTDGVQRLCAEALEYNFASVCIPPRHVARAARWLAGSSIAIGTVVGFPLGYASSATKVFEAGDAVAQGATEIDMVIPVAAALENHFAEVEEEIVRVVAAAAGRATVKVIIECAYLDQDTKIALVEGVVRAGAAYIKTSTGFAPTGATVADVALLVAAAAGRIGVKAAGGIRDWVVCREMMAAGAGRIGTSAGVQIMREWRAEREEA